MKKSKGFTIIEIITVLIIITLIATMAIAGISGTKGRIDNKAYNSKVKLIEQAAALYAKENSEKIREEFGPCTETSGNCDCTKDECVYKFNTNVQELIELGYYDSELNNECLVENPKDRSKCFDKEPIEIILSANKENIEAHFGEEFDPFDIQSPANMMCELEIVGTEGTNGWYIGDDNKLVLKFKIDESNVTKYGISKSINKTYNNLKEIPLSSTTGSTYYGYVKDADGNEGSCVIKNIKVDATNPTDPKLEIDDSFNVAFIGSRDTYSERVKYSYSIGDGKSTVATKYRIPSDVSDENIDVYAFDYAGNASNTVTKRLLIESPVSGTVTTAKTYYCSEGYTCSDSPCKASSSCIKTEENDPIEKKQYKCDLTNKLYNTYSEASSNCTVHESGTVTVSKVYTCDTAAGYTCSDSPCKSTSKCVKSIEESVKSTLKYKCDLTGEVYNTREEAISNCTTTESGTVTTTSNYSCPIGYTCSDNPCKSTSVCRKQESTTAPVNSTYYLCYVDGEYVGTYTSEEEANQKCSKVITGVISTNTKYQCPSGYTCSDGASCNANSTCIKTTAPAISSTEYRCYLNGIIAGIYNSEEEAQANCVLETGGEIVSVNTFTCSDGYTCSDGASCNANSICTKSTSVEVVAKTKYDCYINDTWVTDFNTLEEAQNSCNDYEYGTVGQTTIYSCPSGYTCSDSPCKSTSTCSKKTTTNIVSSTSYSCPSGYTCSDNPCKATSTCTSTTSTSTIYSYVSNCSYNYYFTDETRAATALTSCSSNTVSSCNSSNYGKVNKRCSSYHKWIGRALCKNTGTNTQTEITVGKYDSEASCNTNIDNYTCPEINQILEFKHCEKKLYYSRWEKTCTRSGKWGAYSCSQSQCYNTCPSGYTRSTTRSGCYNSDVEGKSCTQAKTCKATTTTTCTKTTSPTSSNIYSCPSGYTCSNTPCKSTSTCQKTETKALIATTKYTCSLNSNLYDTRDAATSACQKKIVGTIEQGPVRYSCPSGYTCSNTPCRSTSTCSKVETKAVTINNKWKCTLNNALYDSQSEALSNCVERTPLTINKQDIYSCPSGYTCSDAICSQNSICSTENKSKLYATYTYSCSLNNNNYNSIADAEENCITTKRGTVTTSKVYGCPSGYICNDGVSCNASSTCIKYREQSVTNTPKYYCSLTNSFYNNEQDARNNCTRTVTGNVANHYVYSCSSGYTCSDGAACNENSTCTKLDTQNVTSSIKYYCSLTDQFYGSEVIARSNCSRNVNGDILDNYTYSCNESYVCSTNPCTINSICTKTTTSSVAYDTVHYCSINPTIVYLDPVEARDACFGQCRAGKYNLNNKKCYILE